MADIYWVDYVVAGTGAAVFVLGYVRYKWRKQVKSRSMRIGLRNDINHAIVSFEQLRKLLPHANKSRKTIAAATSNLESGAMQLWHEEFAIDTGLLAKISDEMPSPESNNESLSRKELEQNIIDIHHLQSQIERLSTKYNAAIQEDNQIRTDIENASRTSITG